MDGFLLALQFLTIIPVKIKDVSEKNIASSLVYFPMIGLLVGLLLWVMYSMLKVFLFSTLAVDIMLVVVLIIITGGMHLDGLADTADAFFSGKPKQEMLAIMRDPHIGTMGVLGLISTILLKIGLLSSLGASTKAPALLLMCMLSRWSAVLSMYLFPYARQEGKAGAFFRAMNPRVVVFSSALALVGALALWQLKGLAAFLIIGGCVWASGKYISRTIGGITGDTLGATVELAEVVVLLTVISI